MEVSTWKCLISVFVVMILCQAAVAVEQFDLLPCTEGDSGGMPYCIDYDSTGDMCYLHDIITRRITLKLPTFVLTELWLNQGEIVIVSTGGEVINNGQELTRSQDRERWTIEFNFQPVNNDFGKFHLILHIKDVEYRDTQILHMEIRTADNIFVTREKYWFPVQVKPTNGDNPAAEDPSSILHVRESREVLQQKLMTTENDLTRCEKKFYRYLEAKGDLEGTVKHESNEKIKVLVESANLVILSLVLICTGLLLWMVIGSTLTHKTTNLDGNETTGNQMIPIPRNNAVSFENFNGEKLRFTVLTK